MQATIQGARPPYVRFEVREVEDREATIANGGAYTTKDVHFALITPSGSKDIHEKIVAEWFTQMQQFVQEERFPIQWLEHYRALYRAFCEGIEVPLNGTDIRNWALASPSQKNTLRNLQILTVEDLAEANEEALNRMGLGGRELKQQAQAWVKNASAAQVAAEKQVEALQARLAEMEAKMKELAAGNAPAQTPPPVAEEKPAPAPKKL